MAHATVSRCLRRRGMSRMRALPQEPIGRFEWPCPGDLLQMDTKRLAALDRPGHKVTGDRSPTGAEKRERVGLRLLPLDHRRPHATGFHRDPRRRKSARRSPHSSSRRLTFFADHGIRPRRTADRQRLHLHPQQHAARTSRPARHPAPPDPAPNTEAQRQGRALPTDTRARMGLRTALPQLKRSRSSHCPSGSTTTTTTATTAHSQTGPPSAASTTSRGTTPSRAAPAAAAGLERIGAPWTDVSDAGASRRTRFRHKRPAMR